MSGVIGLSASSSRTCCGRLGPDIVSCCRRRPAAAPYSWSWPILSRVPSAAPAELPIGDRHRARRRAVVFVSAAEPALAAYGMSQLLEAQSVSARATKDVARRRRFVFRRGRDRRAGRAKRRRQDHAAARALGRAPAGKRARLPARPRADGIYAPRAFAGRRAVLSQRVGVAFPFTVADIVRFGAGEVRGARIAPMVDAALAEAEVIDPPSHHHDLVGRRPQRAHFARTSSSSPAPKQAAAPGVLMSMSRRRRLRPAPPARHAQCHQAAAPPRGRWSSPFCTT